MSQGTTNAVFPTGAPDSSIRNSLSFFIEGLYGDGLYDDIVNRTRLMYLNWDYVLNSDVGFTAYEDLVEGAEEYNTHDLSTTQIESDSTVEQIENLALAYLDGEESGLFLYTPKMTN